MNSLEEGTDHKVLEVDSYLSRNYQSVALNYFDSMRVIIDIRNRMTPIRIRDCENFWALVEHYDHDMNDLLLVFNAICYGRSRKQAQVQIGNIVYNFENNVYGDTFFSLPTEWQIEFFVVKTFVRGVSYAGLEP